MARRKAKQKSSVLRVGSPVTVRVESPRGGKMYGGKFNVERLLKGGRLIVCRIADGLRMNIHRDYVRAGNPPDMSRAFEQSTAFHWGIEPKHAIKAKVPVPEGPLWEIGKLPAIPYTTEKGNEGRLTYEHAFGKKPRLVTDGKNLFIVRAGANFKIRPEGIVK